MGIHWWKLWVVRRWESFIGLCEDRHDKLRSTPGYSMHHITSKHQVSRSFVDKHEASFVYEGRFPCQSTTLIACARTPFHPFCMLQLIIHRNWEEGDLCTQSHFPCFQPQKRTTFLLTPPHQAHVQSNGALVTINNVGGGKSSEQIKAGYGRLFFGSNNVLLIPSPRCGCQVIH